MSELRRELYDLPEEVHLGGMATQRTRFAREQEQLERLEQEHMKRAQFTKREMKEMRRRQADELQQRADQMDDLKALH